MNSYFAPLDRTLMPPGRPGKAAIARGFRGVWLSDGADIYATGATAHQADHRVTDLSLGKHGD